MCLGLMRWNKLFLISFLACVATFMFQTHVIWQSLYHDYLVLYPSDDNYYLNSGDGDWNNNNRNAMGMMTRQATAASSHKYSTPPLQEPRQERRYPFDVPIPAHKDEKTARTGRYGQGGESRTATTCEWLIPAQPDVEAAARLRDQVVVTGEEIELVEPWQDCDPTVQVRIFSTADNGRWRLQALDEWARPKTKGGDEFYVAYTLDSSLEAFPSTTTPEHNGEKEEERATAPPDLVAWVHDQEDGTYDLEFVSTPMRAEAVAAATTGSETSANDMTGRLTVHFQYTCGIGFLPLRVKFFWKSGASTRIMHSVEQVPLPPYRPFTPPNRPSSSLGDDDSAAPTASSGEMVDFGKYDVVVAFGDSLIRQFVNRHVRVKGMMDNTLYHDNISRHLALDTMDEILVKLHKWHRQDLTLTETELGDDANVEGEPSKSMKRRTKKKKKTGKNSRRRVALLLGSGVWDISRGGWHQGRNFTNHLQACRNYIETIRQAYPGVDLYWKSPAAVHIHRALPACYENVKCVDLIRYISTSRIYYLYQHQKRLMAELNVPFLDVYEAFYLSADQTPPGDVRHYVDEINTLVESYYYPNVNLSEYRRQMQYRLGSSNKGRAINQER